MSALIVWFVTGRPFFLLFYLLPKKLQLDHLCCWYYNFSFYFFLFFLVFVLDFFCRSLICFWFHNSIPIYQISYFLILSLFFLFLFISYSFYKGFIWFNFILQFKLMVLSFSIWSLFWFLIIFLGPFIKVIILFNFTLQSIFLYQFWFSFFWFLWVF
jgi:hypothetical protein